jgi:UDP-glucose 4-epimerase
MRCPQTRFICVRYGNVLASRGSVIPLFHEQIRNGGPVTITTTDMTRFLLSLNKAVDTILAAFREANPGETFIPRVPSARVTDIAAILIGERPIQTQVIGIRPGEKVHEILISEEECHHTVDRERYYAILPILPEVSAEHNFTSALQDEYSSANNVMDINALSELLRQQQLLVEDNLFLNGELLR